MNAYEVEQMNTRIADRWRKANQYETIPVRGPSWSAAVVDADGELIAVHRVTAAPFPISIHTGDLEPEDRAVVVARRILAAGGSTEEVIRFFDAFELPQHGRDRLVRQLREAAS
jgi:hypothetical protein